MNAKLLAQLSGGKTQNPQGGGNAVLHGPHLCITHIPASSAKCTVSYGNGFGMDAAERLKKIRQDAGYSSARAAAAAIGVSYDTYAQHENGTRGGTVPRDAAMRYAKFFRVSLDWLLTGKGTMGRAAKVPVLCYVGAGAEVYPIDDHPQGQGIELVEPPQGITDCVAAIIRGDSMHPLRDGWLIFWAKNQDGVPDVCLGQLCVCQVKDGPMLVKEVRRGSRNGLFSLISWNAPPRDDARLDWASPIIDIRPKL